MLVLSRFCLLLSLLSLPQTENLSIACDCGRLWPCWNLRLRGGTGGQGAADAIGLNVNGIRESEGKAGLAAAASSDGDGLRGLSSFNLGGNEVDSDEIGVATQWKPSEDDNFSCELEQTAMQRLQLLLPSAVFVLGSLLGIAAIVVSAEESQSFGWLRSSLVEPVLDFTGLRKFPAWRAALPLLYVFAGYAFSHWLALCAQKRCVSYLQIDRTTSIFLQGLVKYAAMAFAGSVILKAMGVEAVGLDALLASAGIAAGFASQKILQNLAAGVILLLFRPFKVGDKICVNNVMGWVTKIMLFETTLLTDDRRKISMPNHEIYSGYIDNLTAGGMRRVQVAMLVAGLPTPPPLLLLLTFALAGSSDIAGTRKALEEVASPSSCSC